MDITKDILISLENMSSYTILMKAYIEKKVPWVGTKEEYLKLVEEGYDFEGKIIILTDEYESSFADLQEKINEVQQFVGELPSTTEAKTIVQYIDSKTEFAKSSDIANLFNK